MATIFLAVGNYFTGSIAVSLAVGCHVLFRMTLNKSRACQTRFVVRWLNAKYSTRIFSAIEAKATEYY